MLFQCCLFARLRAYSSRLSREFRDESPQRNHRRLQQPLDTRNTLRRLGRQLLAIHPEELQLEPHGTHHLAHLIVEDPGYAFSLDLGGVTRTKLCYG